MRKIKLYEQLSNVYRELTELERNYARLKSDYDWECKRAERLEQQLEHYIPQVKFLQNKVRLHEADHTEIHNDIIDCLAHMMKQFNLEKEKDSTDKSDNDTEQSI